jgi:hypothetical protein
MNSTGNVLAKVTDQGERYDNSKNSAATESEIPLDRKRIFLEAKAQAFLCHGLNPGTPEGIALANGAQVVLMLRSAGITSARLQLGGEAKP